MPKIILTNHAQYRMLERKISFEEIKQTIKNGDVVDTFNGARMIVKYKIIQQKILNVVYKVESKRIIVITAYYEN